VDYVGLKIFDEITNPNAERVRNNLQRLYGDVAFASLDFADMGAIEA
jgi:hypothetical protein